MGITSIEEHWDQDWDEIEINQAQERYNSRMSDAGRTCGACKGEMVKVGSRNSLRSIKLARFRCQKCGSEYDVLPI